jgi:hypothetical protein
MEESFSNKMEESFSNKMEESFSSKMEESFSNEIDVRVLIQRDVSAYPTSNSCWFSALFLIIS